MHIAKVFASADIFNNELTLPEQMEQALHHHVLMYLISERKSLLDIKDESWYNRENCMTLDTLRANKHAGQGKQRLLIFRSSHNLCDELRKPMTSRALYNLLSTGPHEVIAEQWIFRDTH